MVRSLFAPLKPHGTSWPRVFEAIGALGAVGLAAYTLGKWMRAPAKPAPPEPVLRVRGLVVVDAQGIERIRIGAPLPDPPFLGKRGRRQAPVSGILLMDADGTERSGYVTDEVGQVYLTLDNTGLQAAQFLANASSGVNLQMWDEDGNRVTLMAFGGAPHLELVRRGDVVFRQPSDDEGGANE
jgi:hypothetical protein